MISPFAYLAFEHLPQALEGCSYEVQYRPVLFAGLLGHWGQKGPAEIEPKRQWTFRHIAWLSHTLQVPIDTPAPHPFNPLPLLRLALACATPGDMPNRRVVEALMRHVWRGGADADDPHRLRALAGQLAPVRDPAGDDVKKELRALQRRGPAARRVRRADDRRRRPLVLGHRRAADGACRVARRCLVPRPGLGRRCGASGRASRADPSTMSEGSRCRDARRQRRAAPAMNASNRAS